MSLPRTSASRQLGPLSRIGTVSSVVRDPHAMPRQADEGAPPARIEIEPEFRAAIQGLAPGDDVLVLTWLHLARRDVQVTHPRGDATRAAVGVFATRSPDRPNPIGLHTCRISEVDHHGIGVDALDAVDGTPVIDIKPVLGGIASR